MTLEQFLLSPPVAALLLFGAVFGIDRLLARYSHKTVGARHATDPYACGERGVKNYVSPNYSEFYPYAALFTLVHAMVLIVATAPSGTSILPAVFILLAFAMLYLIFRKVR